MKKTKENLQFLVCYRLERKVQPRGTHTHVHEKMLFTNIMNVILHIIHIIYLYILYTKVLTSILRINCDDSF